MLKGVEVVAQKPLVKAEIDKITYSMEDDPDSKTNTTLEMLKKVPLVTVDGEDNIQVNGSSSFKVHVNGKPNTLMSNNPKEVLRSLPAKGKQSRLFRLWLRYCTGRKVYRIRQLFVQLQHTATQLLQFRTRRLYIGHKQISKQ